MGRVDEARRTKWLVVPMRPHHKARCGTQEVLLINVSTRVGRRDRGSGVIGGRELSLFTIVVVVLLHRRWGRRCNVCAYVGECQHSGRLKRWRGCERGGGLRRRGDLLIGARKRAHRKLIKPSAACLVSKRAAGDTYSTAGGFIRASAGARC